MIGKLTGTPEWLNDQLILDVNGVGYAIHTTPQTQTLLANQDRVSLYTYLHVREDVLELYGFTTPQEKSLFELLLSVSGVGPRTALSISAAGAEHIATAVQEADVAFFTSVPRVGKKLAQKIIIDLKSQLGSIQELELGEVREDQRDIQAALLALGYEEQQILRIMKQLPAGLSTQEAIKVALQQSHMG